MASNRPYRTEHEFVMAFMANVAKTSATSVTGRQRGSQGARPGKPYAGMSGNDLAQRVTCNMRTVAQMIHTITDPSRTQSEWSVRQFVGSTVRWIHHGIPNASRLKALRSHETGNAYGCSPDEVPARWEAFLEELQTRLDDEDGPRLCAWVEYELRFGIHPIADGTGRLATALAAWIMMRRGERMPNYAFFQRSDMHDTLREGLEIFTQYYIEKCFSQRGEAHEESPPFDLTVTKVAS
ncbi:hypothetical protein CO174_03730 [Candidatus Uhrbacteria bacterium CG_4_9_14_3_um_filter_50_9]|uniref:Fido domain-containing protein n=1 Tax=Candidatus Uhrbacteria bacterium CG_4_9_14_3_um_filter_50_9 TaxID=1975035 RepID=A0A2M7XBR0_9BACT|nr:MAG: hypothetical protein CO174_03730 [Candidatus Uhrbacteria bacterium CG_4_9_14_3_um_filter_50_9]